MKSIPVFYNDRMVASAGSFSPSAGKAAEVVAEFTRRGLPAAFICSSQARAEHIKLAHDAAYVDNVLLGLADNGFGNRRQEVADALPYQIGSLLDACLFVASTDKRKRPVACSPSSGFHHAHFGHASGFCTFNGLVVAAMVLLQLGLARRVGILDCDHHYGDGTDDIVRRLNLGGKINHFTAGGDPSARHANTFLRGLSNQVKSMAGCDLVIYQAGADMHKDDPLGGLLTTEQMAQRDRLVFHTAHMYRIPLVWNLAGGYQRDELGTIQPVLDLHAQTMQQCADIYIHEQELRP